VDLDLGDLELQAQNILHLELNEQMADRAGWIHLRNLESGGQGVL